MKRFLVVGCLIGISAIGSLSAQTSALRTYKMKTLKQAQEFFHYKGKNPRIVSGHRGGMIKGFPENSIETFENTLKYTSAFYEVDPRMTKDSVVVLMHDATLDRTTTGKGKVSDHTFAELQQLRLKDPEGNVTDFRIPTLMDAIKWSKGKTILNLDNKGVAYEIIYKIIKESGNPLVMLTIHSPEQARFYLDQNPEIIFSVHILSRKAFDAYEAAGIPWKNMIAYIGPKFTPENKELLKLLHSKGVMCMISAAPTTDKLADKNERAGGYRAIFSEGADILESDLPIEVAAAIKSK